MKLSRIVLVAALAAALAACHRGGKEGDQRTASGEILQGSISDAMIPYESLKSRPPLAPRSAAKSAASSNIADAAASAGDAAADGPPAPESVPAAASTPAVRY